MQAPGHVFVVQGSLTELVCDMALIPTAWDMYVEPYWRQYCPRQTGGPSEAELAPSRIALAGGDRVGAFVPATKTRAAIRYVDVGIGRRPVLEGELKLAAVRWLDEGVASALARVREDVHAGRLTRGRERPLVAVPALGTGEGGFDTVRGEVTRSLLRRCEATVAEGGFDVVIVCLHRSDFAYLQSERTEPTADLLTDAERRAAAELGGRCAAGRLSLFLGAGVSVAAGVPDFVDLVRSASIDLGRPLHPTDAAGAADAAAHLASDVGDEAFSSAIKRALGSTGTALLHGLLASTRTPTVMTTNFDDLFERSADITFAEARPDVLPWERERRTPWVLKMHGSVGRQGRLVITSEDLRDFNTAERPLASVVQAQMLLSDVLFVGYSLRDPNVRQLAMDVRDLLHRRGHRTQTVGTILAIEPLGAAAQGLDDALTVVDLSRTGEKPVQQAARQLEIFCDLLLWHATRDEPAWQLDDRYTIVGGDRTLRENLRACSVPDEGKWKQLHGVLRSYGLGRD